MSSGNTIPLEQLEKIQSKVTKLSKPSDFLKIPEPKNEVLCSMEIRKMYSEFNLNIDFHYNASITFREIQNNRQNCILKCSIYPKNWRNNYHKEINHIQNLVNDRDSIVSKFIADHFAYDEYLRKQHEEQAKLEKAEKLKEIERDAHFFELPPISVRTAINSSQINDPVAGKVNRLVNTFRSDSGDFTTVLLEDLQDGRYKMKLKAIQEPVQIGHTLTVQISQIKREENGKMAYIVKRIKILGDLPDLWQVARDRIMKHYQEIGMPMLFQLVLEKICNEDREIERLLCPNGIRDLRTRQPRVKKLLALCKVRLPTDTGYLFPTNNKFLTFQWIKNGE
jgi:hypothetical protein